MNHPESIGQCEPHAMPCPPSRVIDVRTVDKVIELKLHINNNGEYAYYACLSYCWGGVAQFSTTSAMLTCNIQVLRFENLARTIQDDLVDKGRQLKSTGHIYKKATLAVGVARAKTA